MANLPLAGIVALSLAACAPVAPSGAATPLIGQWGGQHVGLMLGPTGGTLDYDCAAGRIGPVLVARDGSFVASGTHTPATGGPEQVGEADHHRRSEVQRSAGGALEDRRVIGSTRAWTSHDE